MRSVSRDKTGDDKGGDPNAEGIGDSERSTSWEDVRASGVRGAWEDARASGARGLCEGAYAGKVVGA